MFSSRGEGGRVGSGVCRAFVEEGLHIAISHGFTQ